MRTEKINFEDKELFPLAEKRFIEICGFNQGNPLHEKMMKDSREALIGAEKKSGSRALVSFFGPETFGEGKFAADDIEIECNFFAQIPCEDVAGIYAYLFTAGEWSHSPNESSMDVLYRDIWGTAYVDAGIAMLAEKLCGDMAERFPRQQMYLSEAFGPGYFGMAVTETKKFFQLLDGRLIDTEIRENGLMMPEKTCAGLFFVYRRPDIKAAQPCLACKGNSAGCSFCSVKNKIGE